jgi:hypothetical protein
MLGEKHAVRIITMFDKKERNMNTRFIIITILLLGTTIYAQSPEFSHFEFNQASNTVLLAWENSSNAFFEMQASTNLMAGLWGQEVGWTNILGTNPTNSVILPVDAHPDGFFRLLARRNSAGGGAFGGIALRASTNFFLRDLAGAPYMSSVALWDNNTYTYSLSTYQPKGGWNPNFSISNNQSFYYLPPMGEDIPAEWSHAYIKDWRLTSPGALPVTGDVLIEWAAFDSYSTPSNPIPDIPFVDVTVMNSDYDIVASWHLDAPVGSSMIWESYGNPDGYYHIEVDVAHILDTAYKKVYLYSQ